MSSVLEKVEKELKKTREEIRQVESDVFDRWVGIKLKINKMVVYRCNSCGYVGCFSKRTRKKNRRCGRCGSADIRLLSVDEVVELRRSKTLRRLRLREKFLLFLRDVVDVLSKDEWFSKRCELKELGGLSLYFDVPYPSRIEFCEDEGVVYVYFHYFGDRERMLLKTLIELADKYGLRLNISVDDRHVLFKEEEMRAFGFQRDRFSYWMGT